MIAGVTWTSPARSSPPVPGPMGGSLARREPGGESVVAGGVGLRSGGDLTPSSMLGNRSRLEDTSSY